ncbi:AAA family ATPase [Micromonospora sp. NPDC048999]|uniref:AAA family ATPase n=1 Tax=Micromonospora sp. NPDC048999 TaxID=3155391 RepID=UPI0034044A79
MPGYILTGTPGAGKTAILRQLEIDGYPVVEEAATDIIALQQALGRPEPWREPGFAGQVLDLQRKRQHTAEANTRDVIFYDRSPICTLALCRYLDLAAPHQLLEETERVVAERRYEQTAFLVRHQGFIQPTTARRISFEDSLAFEKIHEQTYREAGFNLFDIPAAPLPVRAAAIRQAVDRLRSGWRYTMRTTPPRSPGIHSR